MSRYSHYPLTRHTDLFPLRLGPLVLWQPWQTERDVNELLKKYQNSSLGTFDPINLVKRAISNKVPVQVTEIIPRLKDGGAFVKFTYLEGTSPKQIQGRSCPPLRYPFTAHILRRPNISLPHRDFSQAVVQPFPESQGGPGGRRALAGGPLPPAKEPD